MATIIHSNFSSTNAKRVNLITISNLVIPQPDTKMLVTISYLGGNTPFKVYQSNLVNNPYSVVTGIGIGLWAGAINVSANARGFIPLLERDNPRLTESTLALGPLTKIITAEYSDITTANLFLYAYTSDPNPTNLTWGEFYYNCNMTLMRISK